jgi:hypothetical protein
MFDAQFLRLALRLARSGYGTISPNLTAAQILNLVQAGCGG